MNDGEFISYKEVAVPHIPSRKIGWWNIVNKKVERIFEPHLQYCQFEQDGWKNRTFFMKDMLNMNLQSNI